MQACIHPFNIVLSVGQALPETQEHRPEAGHNHIRVHCLSGEADVGTNSTRTDVPTELYTTYTDGIISSITPVVRKDFGRVTSMKCFEERIGILQVGRGVWGREHSTQREQ